MMLYPTIKAMFDSEAKAQDQRTIAVPTEPPKPSSDNGLVLGGGLVIGGAAIWAAIAKLLEKFGNTAIDAKQRETEQKLNQQKQELEEQKQLSQFFIESAKKDSNTLAEILTQTSAKLNSVSDIFVTNHLNNTSQYIDLYYSLTKRLDSLEAELQAKNEYLQAIEVSLKDIFNVLAMKERQNK